MVHPRAVLADVGHLHQVRIQPGALRCLAERLQMHVRGAGGHHHSIKFFRLDLFADHRLAGIRAHVFVVHRTAHAGDLRGGLRHLRHIHRAGDVFTAPADEDSDSGHKAVFLQPSVFKNANRESCHPEPALQGEGPLYFVVSMSRVARAPQMRAASYLQ